MSSNIRTFYKVLEVDSSASAEVIEAAYRRLARRYHPDLNPNQDTTATMQELNGAYAVLRDPQKRASYDLYLRVQAEAQARQRATAASAKSQSQSTNAPANESRSNPYSQPNVAMATACQKCGR